ncbi:MAG: YraN family protein [Bacteroidia bacterium]
MATHNELGLKGEQLALEYLTSKGFKILEKNYRYLKAEVDLIAKKDDLIILIEVKTRSTDYFGRPEEAISKSKQRLLIDAADHYIQSNNLKNEVRFDAISIIINKKGISINHIEDAFYPLAE